MAIGLFAITEEDDSLLGTSQETVHGSSTTTLSALGSAVSPATLSIDVANTDRIRIVLNQTSFIIPIHRFTGIKSASAGSTLGERAGTGLRVYDETDGQTFILIGRTAGNHVLVQLGTWSTTAPTFVAAVHVTRYLGGLLDHRVDALGAEHHFVMEANVSVTPARPTAYGAVHYNGRTLGDVWSAGNIIWRQAGLYSGLTQTHWAFGSAVYNPLSSRWDVSDVWTIVSATDSTQVQFGASWLGPWEHPYVFADHRYARFRKASGAWSVFALTPEASPVGREWQLLSETDISTNIHYNEPYSTELNFPLYPDKWRMMKFSFDWDSLTETINSETTYSETTGILCMPDLRIHARQADDRSVALRNNYQVRLDIGQGRMYVARSMNALAGGRSDRLLMNVFFETSSASSWDPPATRLRVGSRHSGSTGATGTLRTWVY